MPNARSKTVQLSNKVLDATPFAASGQRILRDSKVAGFFATVGKKTKTFWAQYDTKVLGKRTSRRVRLGHYPDINVTDARSAAQKVLGNREKSRGASETMTLADAWQDYLDYLQHKQRSPKTISQYRDMVERLLGDWLEYPLADLANDPALARKRHRELTKHHGDYAANRAMTTLRAIYNYAVKTHRGLPAANPTSAVDFNNEYRRNTGMSLKQLPEWYKQLSAIENPIRRAFHELSLLTGMRPTALKQAKWTDLNIAERRMHVPSPKGGKASAFDLPLSRPVLRALNALKRAVRQYDPDSAYLFPANSAEGYIVEHKERRLKTGNDLRQSFATVGKQLGTDDFLLGLLMNHKQGNVTLGYVTTPALFDDALQAQSRIARKVVASAGK